MPENGLVTTIYLTKSVSGTTGRDSPAASVVRIAPQQIAHGTFMWHFLQSV